MSQMAHPSSLENIVQNAAITLLARIVTDDSLDRLRRLKRGATYIGSWLPDRSSRSKKGPNGAADIGIAGNL